MHKLEECCFGKNKLWAVIVSHLNLTTNSTSQKCADMVDLLVFPSESDSFGLHKLEMKSNNKSTVVLIVGYFKFFLPLTYSKNNVISS